MIKLVAFDWNGTLLADTQTVVNACNRLIQTLGGKPITIKTYREKFIVPVIDFYESVGLDRNLLIKNAYLGQKIFHKHYEQYAKKARGRAHTKLLLNWLTKNNISSIIISNHTTVGVTSQLERLKLAKYFDEVVANEETQDAFKKRTKETKLKNYMKLKNLKAKNILIVGDSSEEVEIAKKLGSISVAITHGHYGLNRIKVSKPDYLISDLGQIINIVRKINS